MGDVTFGDLIEDHNLNQGLLLILNKRTEKHQELLFSLQMSF